jgi:hypothetical protein
MSLDLKREEKLGSWAAKDGVIAIYKPSDPESPLFFFELEIAITNHFLGAVIDYYYSYCGDINAVHFWVGNMLFHASYANPREVLIIPEAICPFCRRWIPINELEEHLASHYLYPDRPRELRLIDFL